MIVGTTQEATVQRALDAFADGDMGVAAAVFHPDVQVNEATSLPFGGNHVGAEAFFQMLALLGEAYTVEVSEQHLTSAAEEVILRMQMTFTSRATGRSTVLSGIEVYRFTGGLISDIDVYYKDTKAMVDILTT